jgi:hypothetical protein
LGEAGIGQFLTALTVKHHVSASTQNQALNDEAAGITQLSVSSRTTT